MSNSKYTQLVPNSNPGFVGFNLADFSLTPVVRKGESKKLAHTTHTHTWTGTLKGGEKKEFFIERKYGDIPPNAYTEDFLLLLATKAYQQDNPSKIPVSANSFYTIQGYSSIPGGLNIARVFEHLSALTETRLRTNALYDRDRGKWVQFVGRPVGGFTFADQEGKTRIRQTKGKSSIIEVGVVRELYSASITPEFFEGFLRDCIPIDFTKYFNVGGPTARRLYKMGTKYVQTLGDFEIDLRECCVARLGMLPDKVLETPGSALARNIRPEASKVTDTADLICVVEKSHTESGYKLCFRRNTFQVSIPGLPPALQGTEKKAYTELAKRGVNKSLAYELVVEARRRHGRRAERFVAFVLRIYDKERKERKVTAGVLKERIKNPVFFDPAFADYMQVKRLRESRRDARLYPEGAAAIADLFGDKADAISELQTKEKSVWEIIQERVESLYGSDDAQALDPSKVEEMKRNALRHYAQQTLDKWKQEGTRDYRPTF